MLLSLIVSLITILALAAVWRRRKANQLTLGMTIIWMVVWIAVALVFWWPELTNRLADLLHIGRGADVVVYAAIIALLYIVFRLFVKIDKMEQAITILTRENALQNKHEKSSHTNS